MDEFSTKFTLFSEGRVENAEALVDFEMLSANCHVASTSNPKNKNKHLQEDVLTPSTWRLFLKYLKTKGRE